MAGNTCAGEPIEKSMALFSSMLKDYINSFASLAVNASSIEETKKFNSACVFMSIGYIEALINEHLEMARIALMDSCPESILTISKKLPFRDKWLVLATQFNMAKWNDSAEPFQSIRQIESLRNELIHYKADMASRDSPPTKLIYSIFHKFKLSDTSRWIEDDVSTWIDTILEYKELGLWIAQTLELLTSTLFSTHLKQTQS